MGNTNFQYKQIQISVPYQMPLGVRGANLYKKPCGNTTCFGTDETTLGILERKKIRKIKDDPFRGSLLFSRKKHRKFKFNGECLLSFERTFFGIYFFKIMSIKCWPRLRLRWSIR